MAKDVAPVSLPKPPPSLILSAPRRPPAPFKLPWASRYTEEIADRICDEISAGRILSRISIEECWCPSVRQIYNWLQEHEDFRNAYHLARVARAELLANEIVELADDSLDHEKTKIQIDARKWLAGKMAPRDYGERKMVEAKVTAETRVTTVGEIDVSHLTLEEIRAAEALLYKTIEGEVVDAGEAD